MFRDGPVAFRIAPAPASWRPLEVSSASLAFRDEAHAATVLLNARCHRADDGTPLIALTNQLLMGSTARETLSQELEPFDGREALHTKLRAAWDGVPIVFDIYVAKKDGCTYDFVYVGAAAAGTEGPQTFEAFVKSFQTLPQSGAVSLGRHP